MLVEVSTGDLTHRNINGCHVVAMWYVSMNKTYSDWKEVMLGSVIEPSLVTGIHHTPSLYQDV